MAVTVRNLLVVVAMIGVALLLPAPTVSGAQTDEPEAVGTTTSIECPIDVPATVEVDCGALVVPESYDAPTGPQLRLPYIVLHGRGTTPQPDPVVFTAGGPGFSSLGSVWAFATSAILDSRDVIVFEQRGNRFAVPALTCDVSVWWEEQPGTTPCLDSIEAKGVDVAQYTTDNIARDLIELRRALGYERWNLYGSSFSTSLMLLVMDADPVGTRSAILQSVKPPSETVFAHQSDSPLRAIEELFAACAADDECGAAFPDLEERFYSLIRRLNDDPLAVEVPLAGSDESIPLEIDGDSFIDWIVVDQLYGPAVGDFGASYLPLLIEKVEGGETELLEPATRAFWSQVIDNPDWAWGLMFAVNCQQDLPAAGDTTPSADAAAREQLDGFARTETQRAICATWDLPPQPPAAMGYVRSDVPSLVLAGSLDPVTPPEWSRTTADNLTSSTYVEFPGHGHNVTAANPCAAALEAAFLDDPDSELDLSCVATAPGPSFVVPDDIYYAPGLAPSGDDVSIGSPEGVAWIEALVLVSIGGSALAVVVLVGAGVTWLVRRRRQEPDEPTGWVGYVAYSLALFVAVSTVALPFLLTDVHDEYASTTDLGFSMGPRRDIVAATLLAWLTPLASLAVVALAGITLGAWITGRWRLTSRVFASLLVLTSLPIVLLGVRWDLHTMLL